MTSLQGERVSHARISVYACICSAEKEQMYSALATCTALTFQMYESGCVWEYFWHESRNDLYRGLPCWKISDWSLHLHVCCNISWSMGSYTSVFYICVNMCPCWARRSSALPESLISVNVSILIHVHVSCWQTSLSVCVRPMCFWWMCTVSSLLKMVYLN